MVRRWGPVFLLGLWACTSATTGELEGGRVETDPPGGEPMSKPPQLPACTPDTDADGVCDSTEAVNGTDPNDPDSDNDGLSDGDEDSIHTNPLNIDTDGDGIFDADELVLGTNPTRPDAACGTESATAQNTSRPVDIIVVIDNSLSMTEEILGVENNINYNFATLLEKSKIDYQLILISHHGSATSDQSICISAPLSGQQCSSSSGKPANTARFKHYSTEVDSYNSWELILKTFKGTIEDDYDLAPDGWQAWARPGALKVFLEFSDDNASYTYSSAEQFDNELLKLSPSQFGTHLNRNYIFHSIVGILTKSLTDASQPHLPSDPIVAFVCEGAENAGAKYQALSKKTGGLRFPICEPDHFDVIFQEVAKGVVDQVSLPCSYAMPTSLDGSAVDPDRVVLMYDAGANAPAISIPRVESTASCSGTGFYVASGGTIELCQGICDQVTAETDAKLEVYVGCETIVE